MKCVHIINGLNAGGAETMLYKLLSAADRDKFKHTVISLLDGGTLRSRIEDLGVQVFSLGLRHFLLSPFCLVKLRKIINELSPDIIQGWMYHGNLAALAASKVCHNRPLLFWNIRHSIYDMSDEKIVTRIIIHLGARLSHHAICIINNSKVSRQQHEKLGYSSPYCIVIPNGFDTDNFKPDIDARKLVRQELKIAENDLLIGLVGRFHPIKNHVGFIHAAKIVAEKFNNVYFLLIGKGVDDSNAFIIEEISACGLKETFRLLGERQDINRLDAALDIGVSSSYSEGFPNAIGEVMSCGVPCVVTDVGDSTCLVDDTGKVVSPRSSIQLGNAICELLNLCSEERLSLGKRARQRVIDMYSISAVVRQYEKLYMEHVH